MTPKLLIVFHQTPFANLNSQEGLDLGLMAASFNYEVSLLFMAEALHTLNYVHNGEGIYRQNFLTVLKDLELFEINSVYVEKIKEPPCSPLAFSSKNFHLLASTELADLYKKQDIILNF